MRKLLYLTTLAMLAMLVLASGAMAQESSGVVEIAPGGPCATPGIAEDVTGVPIEELPNAFLNRNDPVGTPISSPLDPDGNGIACDHPGATTGTATTAASAPAPTSTGTEALPSESLTVMPDTGGPSFILPMAALLMGSGILGFAVLRRRS